VDIGRGGGPPCAVRDGGGPIHLSNAAIASPVGRPADVPEPRPPIPQTARNFSIGCLLSFTLGMGLFGSVYLMPVFLAYVRGHNALEIGKIMLVTGVAQLAARRRPASANGCRGHGAG
jgi:DHA2 family multidrug resistance protein